MNSVQVLLTQVVLAYLFFLSVLCFVVPVKHLHQEQARFNLMSMLGVVNLVVIALHPGAWHAVPVVIQRWAAFAGTGTFSMVCLVIAIGGWMVSASSAVLLGLAAVYSSVTDMFRDKPASILSMICVR